MKKTVWAQVILSVDLTQCKHRSPSVPVPLQLLPQQALNLVLSHCCSHQYAKMTQENNLSDALHQSSGILIFGWASSRKSTACLVLDVPDYGIPPTCLGALKFLKVAHFEQNKTKKLETFNIFVDKAM